MIDDEWLASFVVFAEELNFTRAAKRLHLSQPALHVQVRKLSEQVGLPLYERHGRGVRLTPQGEAVLAFGRESGERTATFLQELRGGGATRPIVLSAGEGAYLYLLGKGIRSFHRLGVAPLQLLSHDQTGTIEALTSGRAHVGVTAVDERPLGLDAELLLEVGAMVVMPKSHRLAKKKRVRIDDLAHERLVVPPRGKAHRSALARAFLDGGVPWKPAIEVSGWELILHFAKLGLGLAVVNDTCRVPSGMVGVAFPKLPKIPYFLLTRTGAYRRRQVEQLCECLRQHAPLGR